MKKTNMILLCVLLYNLTNAFAAIHYVTVSGAGSFNGTSWANAATGVSLQSIINASNSGDEVWVACGIYVPTQATDRAASFSMKDGVTIYGGFTGTETMLSERDLSCGSCAILSGEIGASGNTDNSYTVVSNGMLNNTAILDGFTIRDGNDDRTPSNEGNGLGGGIYNHGYGSGGSCSPIIRNVLFTKNNANFGGGAFNNGYSSGNSEPLYFNCIFYQNHAYLEAGGMDSYGVGGNASPTIVNTIFYENTSATNVGAMYAWGGNVGGNSNPVLINCIFANNSAANGYGGAFIANNHDNGGATSSSGTCVVTLQNCVVWNNSATVSEPQFHVRGTGAEVVATYSNIDLTGQNGPHVLSGADTGNVYSNPLLADIANARGADNCWLSSDDGLIPQTGSPLINTGTLDNSAPLLDIMNQSRSGNHDIGAYEFQPPLNTVSKEKPMALDIFPNPFSEQTTLNIDRSFQNATLTMVNTFGQTVKQVKHISEQTILKRDNLVNGIYFLMLTKNNEVIASKKLVITDK